MPGTLKSRNYGLKTASELKPGQIAVCHCIEGTENQNSPNVQEHLGKTVIIGVCKYRPIVILAEKESKVGQAFENELFKFRLLGENESVELYNYYEDCK